MEKAERDAILRQGIVLPETPRDRRERAALEEDLLAHPSRGKPVPLRLRHFGRGPTRTWRLRAGRSTTCSGCMRSSGGPRPSRRTSARGGAASRPSATATARFADRWTTEAREIDFAELNDLVERHNRWYPAESRLPMDPRTGDYALVNGRDYRLPPLDYEWVLERFPPRSTTLAS